jgi:hypothetical protein
LAGHYDATFIVYGKANLPDHPVVRLFQSDPYATGTIKKADAAKEVVPLEETATWAELPDPGHHSFITFDPAGKIHSEIIARRKK